MVAPFISRKLFVSLETFGVVFSVAFAGAALGALAFGSLADRFSRKAFLVAAIVTFGVATILTASASSLSALIAVRFLAGVGLGGATPCFLALASDHVPRRIRAAVAAALWSGLPLGGMVGGLMNSWLLSRDRWEAILYVGGIAPLLLGGLIMLWVPKSACHIVRTGTASVEMAASVTAGERDTRSLITLAGMLFTEGRAPGTLLIWISYFTAFGLLAIVTLWVPVLLLLAGMPAPSSAIVVASHGLGGFIGASVAGLLLNRLGIVILPLAFTIGAGVTIALGLVDKSVALASLCSGLIGVFVGGGAAGLIALVTLVYPASIRSTGLGWAIGMARLGQVVAPLLAGWMLQLGYHGDQIFAAMAAVSLLAATTMSLFVRFFGDMDRLSPVPREGRGGNN